jgi:inhibitor of KinA
MNQPRVEMLGDACVTIRFETAIDPIVNARCVALAEALGRLRSDGIRDVIPTYDAVAVHFDPARVDRGWLAEEMGVIASTIHAPREPAARTIEIPVSYGGADGPDLAGVAAFAHCSEEEVIRLHTKTGYRVYMLGFLPGFPYMGSVDPRIAVPRLETPRLRVPAGSVAIAGFQTGIYPFDTPGGWRVIGRTSTKLFDAGREDPFLLEAGDRVQFVAA